MNVQRFGDITAKNQPSPTLLRAIRVERSSLTVPRVMRGDINFLNESASPADLSLAGGLPGAGPNPAPGLFSPGSLRPLLALGAGAWALILLAVWLA